MSTLLGYVTEQDRKKREMYSDIFMLIEINQSETSQVWSIVNHGGVEVVQPGGL